MNKQTDPLREHIVRVLSWEDAHVGYDRAVDGIPASKRGACPSGFDHSAWQLVEHIRIAQDDILDFCVNAKYAHKLKWPDDYWPKTPAPPDDAAWTHSIAECKRTRKQLEALARDVEDLTAVVPTGKERQTYLRAILLAADHVAYHVGQLITLRRALGIWP